MCLRCVCVVLEALLAWHGVFSGVCSFFFHWASGLSVTGAIVGCWARGGGGGGGGGGQLVAGLPVGRPVGVLLPWGVIAVAAPYPWAPNLHLRRRRSPQKRGLLSLVSI